MYYSLENNVAYGKRQAPRMALRNDHIALLINIVSIVTDITEGKVSADNYSFPYNTTKNSGSYNPAICTKSKKQSLMITSSFS